MSAAKVLLAGDCLGGFDQLFKKVAAVNKKNGPFDLLLCVGQFFEEASDDGDIPEALKKYVDGSAQLPVKTYFIGGYGKGSAATLAALKKPAQHGDRNLHYLGRSGVTQLEALNVAYLDGTYSYKAFHAKPAPPPVDFPPPPASPPAAADGEPAAAEGAAAGAGSKSPEQQNGTEAAAAAGGSAPGSPMQEGDGQPDAAAAEGGEGDAAAAGDAADGAEAEAAGAADAAAGEEEDAEAGAMHAAAARAKQRQAQQAAAAAKKAAMQAAAAQVCRHYAQGDVARLKHQLMVLPGEVDLLLTCEWPAGILQQLPAGQADLPGFDSRFAGNAPADLAQLARPRYHVAGGQSIFFTRLPYANPDLGAGPRATRFISLGSVIPRLRHAGGRGTAAAAAGAPDAAAAAGQQGVVGPGGATTAAAAASGRGRAGIGHSAPDTQPAAAAAGGGGATAAAAAANKKFLHALALVPASSMSIEALGSLPEGCGKYPYEQQQQVGQKRSGGAYEHDPVGEHCSWRWLPPKRMRGGFGGMATSGTPFTPWGKPGVVKDSSRSVFVRNLPFEATYEDVASFFSQAGEVEDIRRQAQTDSGRPQPWCHVQFTEYGAVPAACALNGSRLMGREVCVATSTPLNKDQDKPPAGGQVPQDWRMELDGLPPGIYQQQQHGRQHGGQRGRGGARGGHQRQQRHPEPEPGKPVEGCWFCLSSDQVDVDLVSSVGEEVYLALDKGPISPQHALIIPIEHHPSLAALPPAAAAEVGRYMSALRTAAASAGKQLVGFERYLRLRSKGGNHTHINTLPISKEAAEGAADVFKEMGSQHGLVLQPVPVVDGQLDLSVLRQLVGDFEYFLGILPDGSGLAAPLNPGFKAPIQLGRQVLAQLAGAPERADWKACTYSGDEEKVAAEAFRDYFKPFDIMAAE